MVKSHLVCVPAVADETSTGTCLPRIRSLSHSWYSHFLWYLKSKPTTGISLLCFCFSCNMVSESSFVNLYLERWRLEWKAFVWLHSTTCTVIFRKAFIKQCSCWIEVAGNSAEQLLSSCVCLSEPKKSRATLCREIPRWGKYDFSSGVMICVNYWVWWGWWGS